MWQKIRYNLPDDPRLLRMAAIIAPHLGAYALAPNSADLFKNLPVLSSRAIRDVTQTALQRVWQRVAQHGRNGQIVAHDVTLLDQYAEIPGFGQAMAAVGWATFDEKEGLITLPDFAKYNMGKTGRRATGTAKSAAQRSKEWRDRQKARQEPAPTPPQESDTETTPKRNGNGNALKRPEEEEDSTTTTTTTTTRVPPVVETDLPRLIAATKDCTPEIAEAWHRARTRAGWIYADRRGNTAIPITAETAQTDLAIFTHRWLENLAKAPPARPPSHPSKARPAVALTTPIKKGVF